MKFIKIHFFLLSILSICSLYLNNNVHVNSSLENTEALRENTYQYGNNENDENFHYSPPSGNISKLSNVISSLKQKKNKLFNQPQPIQQPNSIDQTLPNEQSNSNEQPIPTEESNTIKQPMPIEQPIQIENHDSIEQSMQIEQLMPFENAHTIVDHKQIAQNKSCEQANKKEEISNFSDITKYIPAKIGKLKKDNKNIPGSKKENGGRTFNFNVMIGNLNSTVSNKNLKGDES